jgi:hypothetical protein
LLQVSKKLLAVTRLASLNSNTRLVLTKPTAASIAARSPHLDWSHLVELEIKGIGTSSSDPLQVDLCPVMFAMDAISPQLKILKLTDMNLQSRPDFDRFFKALASKDVFANLDELHFEKLNVVGYAESIREVMKLRYSYNSTVFYIN